VVLPWKDLSPWEILTTQPSNETAIGESQCLNGTVMCDANSFDVGRRRRAARRGPSAIDKLGMRHDSADASVRREILDTQRKQPVSRKPLALSTNDSWIHAVVECI
jgi:hypothetical protein